MTHRVLPARRWLVLAVVVGVGLLVIAYLISADRLKPSFQAAANSGSAPVTVGGTVTALDDVETLSVPVAAHIVSLTQPGLPAGVTERFAVGDATIPTGIGAGDATVIYAGHVRPVTGTALHPHARTTVLRVITVRASGTYRLGPARLSWRDGLFSGSALVGTTVTIVATR